MLHAIVVDARLLVADVAQTVPLRAALGVEADNVVVCDNIVIAVALAFLLEVDNRLLKGLAPCNCVLEVVEPQVQLDGLAERDLAGGRQLGLGREQIEGCRSAWSIV